MQKELTTKKDYAAIGEEISHELAGDMIKAYETANARRTQRICPRTHNPRKSSRSTWLCWNSFLSCY